MRTRSIVNAATVALACGAFACGGTTTTPAEEGVAKGCRDVFELGTPFRDRTGLSSHVEWGESASATAYRDFEVAAWADLGVGTVRRDLTWRELEPAQGQWEWDSADRVVEVTEDADVSLLALLNYGNSWANAQQSDDSFPPDDPADFGNYAGQVAARYADQVDLYEIWNEPNWGLAFWKPKEDPEAYAALLTEAATQIRAADPDATIAFGGLFHPDLGLNTSGPEFFDEVVSYVPDLDTYVDAIPIHPYRYPFDAPENASEEQASLVESICDFQDQMANHGLEHLELWLGELGWHTAPEGIFPGASEDEQAAWLVRAVMLSFAQGASLYQVYTFRDSGTNPADQEQNFGIYGYDEDPTDQTDAEPKPAAVAYATMTAAMGEHHTISDWSVKLGLDENSWGYALSGGDGTTLVLWSDEEKTLPIPSSGDATRMSLLGDQSTLPLLGNIVTVDTSPEPIYVLLP